MKLKFLNVDLEIKSSRRLLQIEKEFEELGALVLFSGEVENYYLSTFELSPDMDTPDQVIIEFSRLIGCVSEEAKKEWYEAEERVFDVGYEAANPVQNFLEVESIQTIENLEGVIRYTAYQPTLTTERLTLRPFGLSDADEVQRLAGDWAIADTTLNVPHPYEDGVAEEWISTHAEKYLSGELAAFAVLERSSDRLIGAVGITISQQFKRAELGYWIGVPYWGKGYCTEASKCLVDFAFSTLGLHRITAYHLARNPASGRVMEKIGMTKEGLLRDHTYRWGKHEDLVVYGILSSD